MASDLDFLEEIMDRLELLSAPGLPLSDKLDMIDKFERYLSLQSQEDLVNACMVLGGMLMSAQKKVRHLEFLTGETNA